LLSDFANIWSKQLGIDHREILPFLFSPDHYLSSSKTILAGAIQKGRKSLFQSLVLTPLWEVHNTGIIEKDLKKLTRLADSLKLAPLRSKHPTEAFDELMRNWLPLTVPVIKACARGKSPNAIGNSERLASICKGNGPLCEAIQKCSSASPFVFAIVAKFLKIDSRRIALCRIMSGTVKKGLFYWNKHINI
jgi:translation elongation factor EF-G